MHRTILEALTLVAAVGVVVVGAPAKAGSKSPGYEAFNAGVALSLEADELSERKDAAGARKNREAAIVQFGRAIALEPAHHGAYGGRAMALAQLGRTEQAMADFKEAIRIVPTFGEYHRQLGLCHVELGQFDDARRETLIAMKAADDAEYRTDAATEIYNFGGKHMLEAARQRDAGNAAEFKKHALRGYESFHLAQEVLPGFPDALKGLVVVSRVLGKTDEAGKWQAKLDQGKATR